MDYLQAETDFDVVLCDFGFAKDLVGADPTSYNAGNYLYASPESWLEDWKDPKFKTKLDIKSDMFSIGAMFLHMMFPLVRKG